MTDFLPTYPDILLFFFQVLPLSFFQFAQFATLIFETASIFIYLIRLFSFEASSL